MKIEAKDTTFYGVSLLALGLLFATPVVAEILSTPGMPGFTFCEFLIQSVDQFVAVKSY